MKSKELEVIIKEKHALLQHIADANYPFCK